MESARFTDELSKGFGNTLEAESTLEDEIINPSVFSVPNIFLERRHIEQR